MKVYQPCKYERLPNNIYMQTLYIIKDYPDMLYRYKDIGNISAVKITGMPKSNEISNITENQAIVRANLKEKIHAIEHSLKIIPEEYRDGIINNIVLNKRYPDFASKNTWSLWRVRYIKEVAKTLSLI